MTFKQDFFLNIGSKTWPINGFCPLESHTYLKKHAAFSWMKNVTQFQICCYCTFFLQGVHSRIQSKSINMDITFTNIKNKFYNENIFDSRLQWIYKHCAVCFKKWFNDGRFSHIHTYFGIFRHIQAYSHISLRIQV